MCTDDMKGHVNSVRCLRSKYRSFLVNSANNGARATKLRSFDSGNYDEHDGVDLMEISQILVTQDEFFSMGWHLLTKYN